MTDLGTTPVDAIAPEDDEGLRMASSRPTSVSYFDAATSRITRTHELGVTGQVTDLVLSQAPEPGLWIALLDGVVLRVAPQAKVEDRRRSPSPDSRSGSPRDLG